MSVGRLSLEASRLKGYGKAVAASEAALSDLRFVQAVRAVPLPDELASDPEAKNVYYAALDEALEPRKTRGRDAAIVALRFFYELGALREPRVLKARALLSELYAGSRIDALDRVLLPSFGASSPATVEQRLAATLPTFYASRFLELVPTLRAPELVRAYSEQGLPPFMRTELDRAALDPTLKLAHALIEARRGALYFSGAAYEHAAALLGPAPATDAARLVHGIGKALERAPKHGTDLLLAAPKPLAPLGDLDALEALAKSKGTYQGEATFDAAYIRSLAPPVNDAKFWTDLATRFSAAARLLKPSPSRAMATELADSARQTSRAIQPPQLP
jgi:hypothetical protein